MLVQTLLTLWEEKQYLSATAKVASDLDANDFWQSLKFEIVAIKLGGATRGYKAMAASIDISKLRQDLK
jgi:hypothetical protein